MHDGDPTQRAFLPNERFDNHCLLVGKRKRVWRLQRHSPRQFPRVLPEAKQRVRNRCLHLATGRTRDDIEKGSGNETEEKKKVGTGRGEGGEKSRGREK
ncbi:hypothetical protein TNCV_129721 [Trichonephila clavipes]|nr:hypothetical protein TNCV_129721 [Trichonephila clavipes]